MLGSDYERAWNTFPTGAPPVRPRLHHVMNAVVLHTGTGASDIKASRRTNDIVTARHLFCYVARVMTTNSYPQIAAHIKRDHTTVISSVRRIEGWLEKGHPRVTADVEAIKLLVVRLASDVEGSI